MAITRKLQRTVVLEAPQPPEAEDLLYSDELPAAEAAGAASRCPTCGEPLTWHEEVCCRPATTPASVVAEEAQPLRPATFYAYGLGGLHNPLPSGRRTP